MDSFDLSLDTKMFFFLMLFMKYYLDKYGCDTTLLLLLPWHRDALNVF